MTKKVPITEVGSASELMKVPRGSSRKRRMMRTAIAPPKKRATYTSSAFARISSLWSMSRVVLKSWPSARPISASFALV